MIDIDVNINGTGPFPFDEEQAPEHMLIWLP